MKSVKLCIIGAGDRGRTYANYIQEHPHGVQLVAVAEPRDFYRNLLATQHRIPEENVFTDWQQLAALDKKIADAVVIATQDTMHKAPVLALMEKGYDVLLEKPIAPTREECEQIVQAAISKQVIFSVGHVLRYTPYTQELKRMIDAGQIGEVISIQHLEPVGYDHFTHSFVRGHWRRENDSSFMLLSKSCHDLDWMHYIVGSKIKKVSSFGNLKYFKAENKPEGAGPRCVDCPVAPGCPYSAVKIYLNRIKAGDTGSPVNRVTADMTVDGMLKAIQQGPYGRCVFGCDNDVADHQVVNMEFQNGATGVFTVSAFTEKTDRRTRVFGTRGEINADGTIIDRYDFVSNTHEQTEIQLTESWMKGGHGGGDYGLIKRFIEAVARRDQRIVLSGPLESLESHAAVFAAEEARKNGRVVTLS